MKVFISADMEGVAGVVHREHTARNGQEHERARLLMTEEVNACIEGVLTCGAKEIVVNDSHGSMRNVIPEVIHPAADYITGSPKPLAMMEGIGFHYDAAILLGYHSKMGSKGVLNHTFHGGVIENIKINQKDMGEIAISAGIAGHFGVPVVLVTGCQHTADEAKDFIPGIETAIVKRTINELSARHLSPKNARNLIKEQTISSISNIAQIKPVVMKGPFEVEITYLHTGLADAAAILPIVKRISPKTHCFRTDDFITAFRYIRSLIAIASAVG
ncbi:D-amino peptidase [Bacillus thermophilus]|uniref:D-amino peptidase n=1 Tax=Siminovitchia thermophila TaxID=1245522 RepID=A0ABS2R928_9BACI|nr:M55 family metallopeptidase [Siminovitchia thermophila]MBM7716151.1 D-amino peptidase [Siminovitchia thermophila]ONK21495.1 peptidase M55 [Bacillus sp. VT-16-64]